MQLTPTQRQVRDTAREFADKILKPNAARYDEQELYPKENVEKLADLGFLGLVIPEDFGGGGHNNQTLSVALEEINRGCASTGVTISVHNSLLAMPLLQFGSDAQRQRFLPRLATGEWLGAYAITEPNHGSDAAAIESTCLKKGDRFVLNGTKAWITNGTYAQVFIVFATLDVALGSRGICAFLVEKGFPGLRVGKKEKKLGIRASDTVELVLEDLEVPEENLLGEEGQGFKIAMHTLDGGRIGIATQAIGIAQACLDASIEYARGRMRDGKSLLEAQTTQHKIADMAVEIDAARLLRDRAAGLKDRGEPHSCEGSMAKLFASEVANRAARESIQIHGGMGACAGQPVERYFRDAKITEIYEGTSEIQRLVIARHATKGVIR